jgi:AhpD family alkylhydroperoxidase
MTMSKKIRIYEKIEKSHPEIYKAVQNLGDVVRTSGPLDKKTSQLIQLAAAAATQSEGSVHSHTKRALEDGATRAEIEHALMMLVSVMGFPKTAAALSWAYDVLDE